MEQDLALESIARGYQIAILNGKRPIHKDYANRVIDVSEYLRYKMLGYNYGILLRGLMVVDTDNPDDRTKEWLRHHRIDESPMTVLTRRGKHAYFRLEVEKEEVRSKIRHLGLAVDLLTGNRLATGPGSVVGGWTYQLHGAVILPQELPLFPTEAGRTLKRNPELSSASTKVRKSIERVRRYIRERCFAVSGANGHGRTFFAAMLLTEAGLSEAEVLAELLDWNQTNADPPWSFRELEHKAREANKRKRAR